jgi:hypothetical protein
MYCLRNQQQNESDEEEKVASLFESDDDASRLFQWSAHSNSVEIGKVNPTMALAMTAREVAR